MMAASIEAALELQASLLRNVKGWMRLCTQTDGGGAVP
jgi:hypothetical protein